jgi:hypothetical protein
MRRPVLAALTGLLLLVFAGPAAADHGGVHPTFRTEVNYFHCSGAAKVQNVAYSQGQIPSWNTTMPPGSVQQGHGCGYYDPLAPAGVAAGQIGVGHPGAVWEGKSKGNLRDLTLELHRLLPTAGAPLSNRLIVVVTIDGTVRLNNSNVVITPTNSSTNASHSAKITLTGLGYANEDGDGTQERTIRVQVGSYNETPQSAWVFDTTEVPAGITFNAASPSGTIVQPTG